MELIRLRRAQVFDDFQEQAGIQRRIHMDSTSITCKSLGLLIPFGSFWSRADVVQSHVVSGWHQIAKPQNSFWSVLHRFALSITLSVGVGYFCRSQSPGSGAELEALQTPQWKMMKNVQCIFLISQWFFHIHGRLNANRTTNEKCMASTWGQIA